MPTLDADRVADDETIELTDPEPPDGLTVADLTASSCRWPNGDPCDLMTFRYCGEPAHGGPYCERHKRRAYYTPRGLGLFAGCGATPRLHAPCMICLSITAAAFDAVSATRCHGSHNRRS